MRIAARDGVGLDRVDLEAATRRGVFVTITPTVCQPVADLAFGLLICLLRSIKAADQPVRAGE